MIVVYAITATGILANTLIAPSLPDIAREFDVGGLGIGAVVAAASLPGIVVAPAIGLAADRLGRRTVVVPCLVCFGVGGVVGMLAPVFGVLLAARFLQGIGGAGLVNLAVVMIGDRFDGVDRAGAIGRNSAVLTSGLALFPLVGGVLTALGGWRLSFAPYSLAFVVAAIAARSLPLDRPDTDVTWADQLRGSGRWLRDRRVQAMSACGFAAFVLIFGLGLTALPIDLDDRFGAGPAARGVVLGVPALVSTIVALRMGVLSARYRSWDLVITGFAALGIAFAVVAAAGTIGVVVVAALVWGLGEALTIVPLQSYAAGLAPMAHRGVVVALWVAAARAGQAVGPVLAGVVLAAFGSRAVFVSGACAAAVFGVFAAGARVRLARAR